jgi:hypothetical protein
MALSPSLEWARENVEAEKPQFSGRDARALRCVRDSAQPHLRGLGGHRLAAVAGAVCYAVASREGSVGVLICSQSGKGIAALQSGFAAKVAPPISVNSCPFVVRIPTKKGALVRARLSNLSRRYVRTTAIRWRNSSSMSPGIATV